jgi:Cd2+/Zn2+-exporting ATPase
MDRSRNAIRALLKLRPNEATVRRGSDMVVVPIEAIQVGDVVVIRPGERLPIDGRVVSGESNIDQSAITGESMPVAKLPGDDVFAGTVNQNGSLDIRVTREASDTTLARIIKMVEEAQDQRAPTQRFLDEFEQKYALFVIVCVLIYIVVPPLLPGGPTFTMNFYRAMVLMTVASPCALVISTPASILSAIANAARSGILFKGGAHLEQVAMLKAIAFDKTGTITTGKPVVTQIIPYRAPLSEADSQAYLIGVAASVEQLSEHPIASAIVQKANAFGLPLLKPENFESITGQGVRAVLDGHITVQIGTDKLMESAGFRVPNDLRAKREQLEAEGNTVLIVHDASTVGFLGLIAVADELRPDAKQIVQALHAAGLEKVVILTGDNERVARHIAEQVGADDVRANLLPEDKVTAIKALEAEYGPTAMVGDGVNDAPALATATIGIAMGAAGTDVALETADVVLMSDDLKNIVYAMQLSRRARRIVWQNIGFALFVIAVLVISALGLNPLLRMTGHELPLPFGVVGHEGSTLIVVTNGLRLLTYRPK